MYIKIEEEKFIQLKNALNSIYTFASILADCKIIHKNEHIANLLISLVEQPIKDIEESQINKND